MLAFSGAVGGVVPVGRRWHTLPAEAEGKARSRVFSRPTHADRDRRRADLINRARLVRAHGWDDYRAVWSIGEVVGVAALLGDHDILGQFDESLQTAWAPLGVRFVGPGRRPGGCRRQLKRTRRGSSSQHVHCE